MNIEPYVLQPIQFLPYEEVLHEVAELVMQQIKKAYPHLALEHIGSTAARIAGKNSINIIIPASFDQFPHILSGLETLGFASSPLGKPEPATRPLRVGAVRHRGTMHNIHVHVLIEGSDDHHNALFFRDYLIAHPKIVPTYTKIKQTAVAEGHLDAVSYNHAKEPFIRSVLAKRISS